MGAAFAAVRDDELTVDLWGGVADPATGKPWERDTMVLVVSGVRTRRDGRFSARCLAFTQRRVLLYAKLSGSRAA